MTGMISIKATFRLNRTGQRKKASSIDFNGLEGRQTKRYRVSQEKAEKDQHRGYHIVFRKLYTEITDRSDFWAENEHGRIPIEQGS